MAKKKRSVQPVARRTNKVAHGELYLAALRGEFGDWAYYVGLMPVRELAARVSYADEIHENKRLAEMIQRKLDDRRAAEVHEYLLRTKERFFNAIVVGVYGGDPVWHELALRNRDAPDTEVSVGDFPVRVRGSVGVLRFTGREELFALDGQHRLAGLRLAVETGDALRESEELSVLFVAHARTDAGMERTRRLFTTLNKSARKVTKGEIIALDEDDICAICARRLVDDDAWFREPRIAIKATNQISVSDGGALTTIGNLYDVLKILFVAVSKLDAGQLLRARPTDGDVEKFLRYGRAFFEYLAAFVPAVKEFFDSKAPSKVVERYRARNGGHLLYRPAGLQIAAECVARLTETSKSSARFDKRALAAAVQRYAGTPMDLASSPFRHVMWDPMRKTMDLRGRALARDLVFYILRLVEPRNLQERVDERIGEGILKVSKLSRV